MTRLINHFLILTIACATVFAATQGGRTIGRIEFEGLQQVAEAEALATSGLKVNQPFKVEEVDAAAQRLLDSGIFRQIRYRTRTAGDKVTITFQVEEAKGGGDSPVIFDNFIWFTDEQLIAAVRRQVPTFDGRAPNSGKMPEGITRALQQLLVEQNIAATVEYLASQDLSGRLLGHVFTAKGIKMPICTFHFPGAKNVTEAKLSEVAKEISNSDYSRELVRVFAGMKLTAVYRELGQLRVKFATPTGKPDPTCKSGVAVTVPVEEGLIYSLGQIDWSGANALTVERLNEILRVRPGEIVNGVKFDQSIIDVLKAFGREGYIDAQVQPAPEFDDSAQKVTYKIEVQEGPQYRMGSLLFKGLTERDAKALRDVWKLRRGEVYDEGYLHDFFQNEVGNAIQRLVEERKGLGKQPPRIGTNLKANKDSLTVDVTLELAN